MDTTYGDIGSRIPLAYRNRYEVISDERAGRLTGPFAMFKNSPKLTARYILCDRKTEYQWKKLLTDTHYVNFDEVGFHTCLIDQNDDVDKITLNTREDEG